MKRPIDKDLLIRYAQGTCTPGESERVKEFLLDPEWKRALNELLEEDFKAFNPPAATEATMKAWQKKFRDRLPAPAPAQRHRHLWLRYAAVVVIFSALILSLARLWSASRQQQPVALKDYYTQKGERMQLRLPDSSVVFLGANSHLQFPVRFTDSTRSVTLQGEGFFEVTHNTAQPFIVRTGEIQTHVVGTSFKVDAVAAQKVVVSVATGKVRVERQVPGTHERLVLSELLRGDEITWDIGKAQLLTCKVPAESVTAWKHGMLAFTNTSLSDIARKLENWYSIHIHFSDPALQTIPLSVTIQETTSMAQSLRIICSTAHLAYTIQGTEVTISNDKKGSAAARHY